MLDLWDISANASNFKTLDKPIRDEIINTMLNENAVIRYNYVSVLSTLLESIDDDELALQLFILYAKLGNSNSGFDSDSAHRVVININNRKSCKDKLRKVIKNSGSLTLKRSFLILSDKNYEEESIGLRALSGVKFAPPTIYTSRYKPTVEAMKMLPPITRIKALEALISNSDIAYNIFENFTNKEEFKSLLFGAVIRYRDRAEEVWNKYNEISLLNKEATAVISGNCENCGHYEFSIKNTRVHTKNNFMTTRVGLWLDRSVCPLCGVYGQEDKTFNGEKIRS